MRVAPDLLSVAQGQRRYALLVQKQPGTDGTPSPSGIDGEMLTFELDLATDVAVEIAYE
jgi:hypothetical protein